MRVMHDLTLRLLRAFVAVAERRGFSAAASALHLTQPALSRRIAELESGLGIRLFERTSRRVELTQEGQDLLERSRDLLRDGEALSERARALAQGKAGILRVGCAPMIMESVVVPLIGHYRKRFPDVDVRFHESGGAHALQAVLRGELHAAVASPMEPRLQTRLLFPWRLLAVMASHHPLARARTIDMSRLAQEPILTLPAGFGTRALFEAGCETVGACPAIRMEAAAAQTLVAAARASYGVAVVPSVLTMSKQGVKVLPVLAAGKSLGRWLAVAWDANRPRPSYLPAFIELLESSLKRDYPGSEYQFAPRIRPPESRGTRPIRRISPGL